MLKNLKLSAKNITAVRGMVLGGMMVAMYVILGLFKIPISPDNKISLTFIALVVSGYVLGPVPSVIVGALGDIVGFFVAPTGTYFPGFTVSAALSGAIFGLCLYKRPFKHIFLWLLLGRFLVTFGVNIILNTQWLAMMNGKAANFLALGRIIKNLISFPIQYIVSLALVRIIHTTGLEKKYF